jgi:hypothetical protein
MKNSTFDVSSILELLHGVVMGNVPDVSEAHAVFNFRVEDNNPRTELSSIINHSEILKLANLTFTVSFGLLSLGEGVLSSAVRILVQGLVFGVQESHCVSHWRCLTGRGVPAPHEPSPTRKIM